MCIHIHIRFIMDTVHELAMLSTARYLLNSKVQQLSKLPTRFGIAIARYLLVTPL